MRNIVLIGFMGTGKTSTGRLLASRLGRPFIDVDRKVEAECGMSVTQIFAMYGPAGFRQRERAVIAKISRYKNTVIATGGGLVLTPENMYRLKKNGIIITLTADIDVILERTSRRNTRPLLNCANVREVVSKLLAEREHLYQFTDFSVDTSSNSPQQVTERIIAFLREGRFIRGR